MWITFSAGAPPVREYLGRLGDQLEPYRLVDMRPLFRRSWTLPCNWKAVLDQATESYHLGAVHPRLSRVVDAALTCAYARRFFRAAGPYDPLAPEISRRYHVSPFFGPSFRTCSNLTTGR